MKTSHLLQSLLAGMAGLTLGGAALAQGSGAGDVSTNPGYSGAGGATTVPSPTTSPSTSEPSGASPQGAGNENAGGTGAMGSGSGAGSMGAGGTNPDPSSATGGSSTGSAGAAGMPSSSDRPMRPDRN